MIFLKRILYARVLCCFCSLFIFFASPVKANGENKIRVLILTENTHAPLRVFYMEKGGLAKGLLLPFGSISNAVAAERRNDKYNAAIGLFDRRSTLVGAIEKEIESKYPVFDVIDNGDAFNNDGELKGAFERAKSQGINHVLVITDEFTGLTAGGLTAQTKDVSVMSTVSYALYHSAKGGRDRWAKERVYANSLSRMPLDNALMDRSFLETHMPAVHLTIAKSILGGMMRSNVLHRVADEAGKGSMVPALGMILGQYEKRFMLKASAPKQWRAVKMNTPYVMVVEPESDLRFKLGVRADIDLLIPELGQDLDSMESYQKLIFSRLSDAGYDASTLSERTDFYKNGYQGISISNSVTGAGRLILFKRHDSVFVSMITLVATEDFENKITQHKDALQAAIDGLDIKINSD